MAVNFDAHVEATTASWDDPRKAIVVAADGSDRNRAAIEWATLDAAATGRELTLVTVIDDNPAPVPHFSRRSHEYDAKQLLGELAETAQQTLPAHQVHTEVVAGSPVECLLDRSAKDGILVLGKRGLGTFTRIILGSTSTAVAARSRVPVAIIPDGWRQTDHASAPVVVGIDPDDPIQLPLGYAFGVARRRGVPVVAVHAWEVPAPYDPKPGTPIDDPSHWERESAHALAGHLDHWRSRFEDVELRPLHTRGDAAMALLNAASDAQLLVLGRQHRDGKLDGFAFGSVAHAVLHYTECPTVVLPTDL